MRGVCGNVFAMKSLASANSFSGSFVAWLTVALFGVVAPVAAMLMLADASSSASLLNGVCLIVLARALGMAAVLHPISAAFAIVIATLSFAARGALFARSAGDKGWLIAVFVVMGEAAILVTSYTMPDALPDWLLVLLPAQWANIAIQSALSGTGTFAAIPVLLALGGTALSTLLVARLLPRRWPYLIMFTAWLSLSALVWYWPV